MANPSPAPAPQKSGLGCFGCGCIILIILAALALGLMGGGAYLTYRSVYALTSPTAADVPTFDGGDDVYNGADQKVTTFNEALQQNQPASLQLSADEMNSLIERDPNFALYMIRLFIATNADQAHVQASLSLDRLPLGLFKGRFLNIDATLSLNFDNTTHTADVILHSLKIGDKTIPDNNLPLVQQKIVPILNAEAQKSPYLKNLFAHAKTIEVKDGEFVIETE